MRYVGQGFEVPVALPDDMDVDSLAEAFHHEYERRMGHRLHDVGVEVVTWRLVASGPSGSVDLATLASPNGSARAKGQRQAHFAEAGGFVVCDVYDRYALPVGVEISGPAIVEEHESTAVIGPGASARVDSNHNLVVSLR
jgi:N-methylhydantoinase A